jgi:hypothetical protein
MSDLTRSTLIPCHRCGRPCDAFMLLAEENPGWPRNLRFCTWYCADQYHKTTGNQIYNSKSEVVIAQNKPLYVEEQRKFEEFGLHCELLNLAFEQMAIELLG